MLNQIIPVLIASALVTTANATQTRTVLLTVELTGLKAATGALYVSIQTEAQFQSDTRISGGSYVINRAGKKRYTFTVPEGDYSISVWHDTNNDGKFSTDENWLPTDGWASSGTPNKRGRPTFDETKISVSGYDNVIRIPMVYPVNQ